MRVLPTIVAITIGLAGCSTGDYLKPSAGYGRYSTENPACPGAQEVLEFFPTNENWIIFRVAAKLPDRQHSRGTRLIAYFRFVYYMPPAEAGTRQSLFPSAEAWANQEELVRERARRDIIITAPSPMATVVFPDGSETMVSLPFFEKPFNHQEVEYPNTLRGPEVVISPEKVETFKVIFPDIYFNGKKLEIPPVDFKKASDTYAPVLNC